MENCLLTFALALTDGVGKFEKTARQLSEGPTLLWMMAWLLPDIIFPKS